MNADQHDAPGLSLLVNKPSADAVLRQTGLASLEHGHPIGPNTTFNTGSVAKQITAHLVLLAAQDNLLRLSQKAADLLPRLKISDVTVADLVTHHSGIRDAESLLSLTGFRDLDHYTADDLRVLAYRQHRRAVPKDQFLYSNTNYLLLAELLEAVHRATLPDLARHQLFDPIGMHSTHFKADLRHVIPRAASAYQITPHGWQHTEAPVTLPGPGSMWTTVGDLDRWLGHLHQEWPCEHQFPGQNVLIDYKPSDHRPYLYGPGVYADPRPGRTAVFHYGHEQGFSASTYLDITGLRLICLSNNADIAADQTTAAVLRELSEHPDQDPSALICRATLRATPNPAVASRPGHGDHDSHIELGTFACDQVTGTLRLTHHEGALHLWRRGARDELLQTGPRAYTGNGYTLTLNGDTDQVDRFTLDLDRAPGLAYVRC